MERGPRMNCYRPDIHWRQTASCLTVADVVLITFTAGSLSTFTGTFVLNDPAGRFTSIDIVSPTFEFLIAWLNWLSDDMTLPLTVTTTSPVCKPALPQLPSGSVTISLRFPSGCVNRENRR